VIRRRTIFSAGVALIVLWLVCEIEWLWRPPVLPERWSTAAQAGRIAAACLALLLGVALHRIRRGGWAQPPRLSRCFLTITGVTLVMAPGIWAVAPLRLLGQHEIMRDAAGVIEALNEGDRPLIAVNYWLYYWTDRWVPLDVPRYDVALAEARPGTLFAWDARFCLDADLRFPLQRMVDNPAWRAVWASPSEDTGHQPFLVLFRRRSLQDT
jgi:hypothetical protein